MTATHEVRELLMGEHGSVAPIECRQFVAYGQIGRGLADYVY
jgi:hypothetical protein